MKNDLISRSALIDEIEKIDWYHISEQGNLAHGANSKLHTALYKADDIFAALENAPAIDAVEVVRCKDCKFAQMGRNESVWCRKWDDFGMPVDFTCGEGERRGDDAND